MTTAFTKPSIERLCQIEIQAFDPEKLLGFYEMAFGWERSPAEMQDYYPLTMPLHATYGISLLPGRMARSQASSLSLYFACDDLERLASQVQKAGGVVRGAPKSLPGFGLILLIDDPEGNRFGFFAAKSSDLSTANSKRP